MGLEQIITVNISRQTQSISQAGFGTALILGLNGPAAVGTLRSYSSLTDVGVDFNGSQDEYKAAQKLFSQSPKPTVVKIGKMLAKVAQINTITPTPADTTHFIVTIDGVAYDFTSGGGATATSIVTGLKNLINADSACNEAATGTTTLILTSKLAGQPSVISVSANLANVLTTPNVGVVESLQAITLTDNDWYALITTLRTDKDVLQLAAYIETTLKIMGVSSSTAALYDPASTTDLAYKLKAASYFRTWIEYSSDSANYPEAGLFGRCLPTTPGSETWAFKTVAGQVVDGLTTTQINALKAKNCGYYIVVGGQSITLDGKVAGGEFIDIIRLIDLLAARMQESVFGDLARLDKIPFTNGGITLVESRVRGVLKANQKTGGVAPDDVDSSGNLVPGFSTNFPKVSDVSSSDRAARNLTGGTWTARMSGAIHAATINGTVTV